MILGRSSLIQTPCTLAQSSMSEHSSPAKTPGLARLVSKPGSLNPQVRRRRRVPAKGEVSYVDPKTSFGIGVPDVFPTGVPTSPRRAKRGKSDAALFQRPGRLSRQGRPDDHGGVSAGQQGPNPSAQRTWVHLRTGRLNRDAGERRKRRDSQAWSDFL